MSLAEQVAEMTKPRCTAADRLNEWVEGLPESEKEIGFHVLRSPQTFSPHIVVKMFRREGASLSKETVIAWREANNVTR